jgi:hypothetical protein
MITIDRLNLWLPPGYRHRAEAIARLLVRELASTPWPGPQRIEHLTAGPLRSTAATSDHELARRIAGSILAAAGEGRSRHGGTG